MVILSESIQKIPTGTGWIFFAFVIIAFIITVISLLDGYYKSGLAFLAITLVQQIMKF